MENEQGHFTGLFLCNPVPFGYYYCEIMVVVYIMVVLVEPEETENILHVIQIYKH